MDRMDYEQYKKDLAFRESSNDKTKQDDDDFWYTTKNGKLAHAQN